MERISGLKDRLFKTVKYALFFTKREAPDPSTEIEIEQDEFAYLTQNYGEAFQDRKRTKYQIKKNKHLGKLLGKDWDIRILNRHLDFSFVILGTARYWLKERKPIVEFTVIGDTAIEQKPFVLFSFVGGDGTKADYKGRNDK